MKKVALIPLLILALFPFSEGFCGEVNLYLDRAVALRGGKAGVLSFSPDGGMFAWGVENGGVYLLELEKGDEETELSVHNRNVTGLLFSPDGRFLASASEDGTVRLTDLESEKAPALMKQYEGNGSRIAFSSDGRYLAAGGEDDDIFIWEVPSGQLRARLKGHEDDILEIAFDQSSGRLISVGEDGVMMVWGLPSLKLLRRYNLETGTISNSGVEVISARVSPDRLFVAAGVEEHVLQKGGRKMLFKYHIAFFDIEKGMLLKILEDNNRTAGGLALYPGNCFVAFDNSTLREKKLALRNIETSEFALQYSLDDDCTGLAFSPRGERLAAALESSAETGDPVLYIWEVDYQIPASGCFMGRIRLSSTSEPVIGAGLPRAAAVLPFGVSGTSDDTGLAASHFLESRLAQSPSLKLVERSRVEDIIEELEFQQSELADRASAARIGKILGAAYMITGNVDRVGADLVISARIIMVETGEILGAREVHCGQCGSDDLFDAIDILAPALVGR
ncbi:MAG: hypothetical protein GF417_04830 [Candidatus Latescibacteria bacterium]|nr:hypothetical protein [bacterium]MBD3423745.1 hypothetical protein [Candidatus Latescibacterota bacterium]